MDDPQLAHGREPAADAERVIGLRVRLVLQLFFKM
jgi:hypothetical protein